MTLMACQPHSRHWAVWVVLHREYEPTLLLHWDRVTLGTPELQAWQSPQVYQSLAKGFCSHGCPIPAVWERYSDPRNEL